MAYAFNQEIMRNNNFIPHVSKDKTKYMSAATAQEFPIVTGIRFLTIKPYVVRPERSGA